MVAYYCLHKLHKFPNEYLALSREEKAFVIASIELRGEREKEEAKKVKTPSRKRK